MEELFDGYDPYLNDDYEHSAPDDRDAYSISESDREGGEIMLPLDDLTLTDSDDDVTPGVGEHENEDDLWDDPLFLRHGLIVGRV